MNVWQKRLYKLEDDGSPLFHHAEYTVNLVAIASGPEFSGRVATVRRVLYDWFEPENLDRCIEIVEYAKRYNDNRLTTVLHPQPEIAALYRSQSRHLEDTLAALRRVRDIVRKGEYVGTCEAPTSAGGEDAAASI